MNRSHKKTTKSQAPEFLEDLINYSSGVLVKHGFSAEKANIVAKEISKQMCEEWGGQSIYFPYWLRMEISSRDREIYAKFNGHNHAELSKKYKRSLQTIYNIVNTIRAEEIARRQKNLEL